jgi:FeS assembly protein IscX
MAHSLRWTDSRDIAIALDEKFPSIDILSIRFTDLKQWVIELDGFSDDATKCNEKILEAIQMTWLDERD